MASTTDAEADSRPVPADERVELGDLRELVEAELRAAFPAVDGGDRSLLPLKDAIDYSLLGPGKRIRPVLTLAAVEACDGDMAVGARVGSALELVHAYSLVHDDLPAMDDDDLRRGRPTSHRRFGEATAVLVGDALQARAFGIVAEEVRLAPERRVAAVQVLAAAAGWRGMVGGQFLDVEHARTSGDVDALRDVHDRKTGALIAAAVELGAIASGAAPDVQAAFATFGRELGWLFQLVDDLLDSVGDGARIGKTPGKDARSGKVTAVDVFGGEAGLRSAAADQLHACLDVAAMLPAAGGRLPGIARFVHGRDH